jgi:hypothetical protein
LETIDATEIHVLESEGTEEIVDRELSRVPKRYEVETLVIDGIDAWKRYVHSRKITSEKIERRSAKTPETQTPK